MSSSLNVDESFKDREGMRKPNAVGLKREVNQRVIKTNSLKHQCGKRIMTTKFLYSKILQGSGTWGEE